MKGRALAAVLALTACDDGGPGEQPRSDGGVGNGQSPWNMGTGSGDPGADAPSRCAAPSPTGAMLDEGPVRVRGAIAVTDGALGGRDALTVVGDCNGDGRVDVVHYDAVFARGAGGMFTRSPLGDLAGRKVGAMADLDGDGAMDLALAGAVVEWRRGDGACGFGPPRTIAAPVDGEPAQVLVHDVDRDGLADLTVARQATATRAYQLLIARGDGRYADETPAATPVARRGPDLFRSFGAHYADLDGDGALDLLAAVDERLAWISWGSITERPTFTVDACATWLFAPSAPMSVSPIDHDRDGRVDYFVSGTFGRNLLLRGTADRRVIDRGPEARVAYGGTDDSLWASYAADFNTDGWQDLLVLVVPDDRRGPGAARLWINQRDGRFARAPRAVLDFESTAEGMACADFDGDGHPACLARDHGARGLVLLQSHIAHEGAWVGVRLRGTVSSPDASGARVALADVSPPLVVEYGGQSPTLGEHDRGAILAIGERDRADVVVTWPSGIVQRVNGLRANAYETIVEPRVLSVSTRVARADGIAEVEVMVDPAAVGARGFSVEREGAGEWVGPVSAVPGGRYRRVLRAPATPGTARIAVSLDALDLRVRPRVRFE